MTKQMCDSLNWTQQSLATGRQFVRSRRDLVKSPRPFRAECTPRTRETVGEPCPAERLGGHWLCHQGGQSCRGRDDPETWCPKTRGRKAGGFKIESEVSELMRFVRTDVVAKRLFLTLLFFSVVHPAWAQQDNGTKPGSWSGVLVSSACNADEAFNESPECTRNVPGAKISLYDDTNRVIYGLEPPGAGVAHLGDTVTVRGILDGDTIQTASIELMSIGLAVGQKAPVFSVRDQFDRAQTLDTLRGSNGTVLLFFRSADW
jgi:hypothetical protein